MTGNILPEALINEDFKNTGTMLADVNGDGLIDLMVGRRTSSGTPPKDTLETYLNCSTSAACTAAPETQKSAFWMPASADAGQAGLIPPEVFTEDGVGSRGAQLVDMNGDGLTDIVMARTLEKSVPTDKEEENRSGHKTKPIYELYSRTWLNVEGRSWQESPQHRVPVPFVRPIVRDHGVGDEEGFPGFTVTETGAQLFDLNNDRLPDIIYNYQVAEKRLAPNNQYAPVLEQRSGAKLFSRTGWTDTPSYVPPRRIDNDMAAQKRQIHYSDLNGDSLVDLLFAEGAQSETFMNTGLGWSAAEPAYRIPADVIRDSKGDQGFRLIDLNGDQMADIAYSWTTDGGAIKGARLNTGAGFGPVAPAEFAPPLPFAEHERGDNGVRPLDLNGDGLQDLVQAYKRSDVQNDRLVYVNETDPPYLLMRVTDGMGYATEITSRSFLAYQYPEERKMVASLPLVRSSPTKERVSVYPYIHAPLPGYLVTRLTKSGAGVPARQTEYQYDGYRVDILSGRSLGFEEQVTIDVDHGRHTHVRNLQEEGYLGAPALIEVYQGRSLVSRTRTAFSLDRMNGIMRSPNAFVPTVYRRTVASTQSESWDLKGAQLGGQEDRFQYDSFANATEVRSLYADGSETLTQSVFADDADHWLLSRMIASTVTMTSPGKTPVVRHSSFAYDPRTGLMASETANAGTELALTTSYTRDAFGNKIAMLVGTQASEPARGESYKTDIEGRFVTVAVNAVGHRTTTDYDLPSGAVLSRTDANGVTVHYAYDDLQRQITETSPTGIVTRSEVTFATTPGDIVAISRKQVGTLPASLIELDAAGRPHRALQSGWGGRNVVIETQYDRLGRVVATSLPHFVGTPARWASRTYDALDRVLVETRPDGSTLKAAYEGLSVRRTNAKGDVSTSVMNLRSQVTHIVDAMGGTTRFEYDAATRVVSTINAIGQVSRQEYDLAGRRVALDDPTVGRWTFNYTRYGQLEVQTDPRGRQVRMTYDAIGRISSRTTAESSVQWSYDLGSNGLGRLSELVTGQDRKRTFLYDRFSRLWRTRTAIGRDAVTTSFNYDEMGRVVGTAYSTGVRINNRFDAAGYFREVTLSDQGQTSSVYRLGSLDAAGRILSEDVGNGTHFTTSFDEASARVTRMTAVNAQGEAVQDLSLGYDANGNLTRMTDVPAGRSSTYEYDPLGRLTTVASNLEATTRVTYDPLGNILTKGDAVFRYCDKANRQMLLCSVEKGIEVSRLDYDDAGNVIQFGAKELVFDDQGRVTSITGARAAGVRSVYSDFTYGANGELETQKTRDVLTSFDVSYFGDVEVVRDHFTHPDRTSERTRVRHFINAPSGVIGFYEKLSEHFPLRSAAPVYGAIATAKPERVTRLSAGFVYFAKDQLGSIRVLMNGSGKVLARLEYDPWGKRIGNDTKALEVRQGFTGHEMLDHLGLIHMGGRVYSADLGRFLSPDPFVQSPDFSQSYNRYAYVLNNPLNLIDPSGYWGIRLPSLGDVFRSVTRAVGSIVDAVVGKPLSWVGEQLAKGGRWLQQNWRVVVIIAATVALGPAGTFAGAMLTGAAIGGFSAILYGGSFEDVLRGAALGAITGGAFYGAGNLAQTYKLGTAGAATIHGVAGGATSVLQGGKFESGFLSSFVSRSLGGQIEKGSTVGERVARAAIIGGVASEVGGGSFENGAITSAFAQMYNSESHVRDAIKKVGSYVGLDTEFEGNMFDRFWAGDKAMALTTAEFQEITDFADAHPERVSAGPNPNEYKVSFYSSEKYNYSLGEATLIKDQTGAWVGMRDKYNFDSRPWFVRSVPAELATMATGAAHRVFSGQQSREMQVCFPPSACGAPSREPPKPATTAPPLRLP